MDKPLVYDPEIEAYKDGIDRTLLRENLKLTVEERLKKLQSFVDCVEELRRSKQRQSLAHNER